MRPNPRFRQYPSSVPVDAVEQLLEQRNALLREVDDLRAQNEELTQQLAERALTPTTAEVETALFRRNEELQADLERVQHRTALEAGEARDVERARRLADLGDVLDSVDRGLEMDGSGGADDWRAGLVAIKSQLLAAFREAGANLTGAVGEVYDPELHHALRMVAGQERGQIAQVARRGIVLENGRVVRPAQVYVVG